LQQCNNPFWRQPTPKACCGRDCQPDDSRDFIHKAMHIAVSPEGSDRTRPVTDVTTAPRKSFCKSRSLNELNVFIALLARKSRMFEGDSPENIIHR
jgi:hypothetical protein